MLAGADKQVRDTILHIAASHLFLEDDRNPYSKSIGGSSCSKALANQRQEVLHNFTDKQGIYSDAEMEVAVFMSYLYTIRTVISTQHVEQTLSTNE